MSFGTIAAAVSIASAIGGTYMSVQGQKSAAKAAEQSAEWNADQARKQASFEEATAQTNMRRKRENNKRVLARQRAMGARSGLTDAGAVGDMLVDNAERLQTDVDDIWSQASTNSQQLQGQANMSIWEGAQAKTASKYAIYGTVAKGAADVYAAGSGKLWGKDSKPATPPAG